ncbi:unnamed protein product [Calypogeia fissa]
MENAANLPRDSENVSSVRVTRMAMDPSATRKNWNVDNGAVAVTTVPTAAASQQCDTKMDENLSPSVVLQENSAPMSKTPLAGVELLKKSLPFRERNMEEGRKLLPPHIKVPPKKLFGYPERYRSPTDAMVSPVSRGLLIRNRRPARTLAPMVPPKALENTFHDVVVDVLGGESGSNQVPA